MSKGKAVKYKMGVLMQVLDVVVDIGGRGEVPVWEDGEYFEVEADTVARLSVAMWREIRGRGYAGRPLCHPPVEVVS